MNYDNRIIQTNLLTVVGFEQSQDPQAPILPTNLTTATSGLKINDGSVPYMNLQTIKDLAINYDYYQFSEWNSAITYNTDNYVKYTYPEWSSANTYAIGERIVYNEIGFESLITANLNNSPLLDLTKWKVLDENYSIYKAITNVNPNLNKQPDINPLFWTAINLFYDFLEKRLKTAITNVVSKIINVQNTILESKRFYYGIGRNTDLIENETDTLVGFKIDFYRNQNIKIKLNKIGLYFSEAVTDLEILLYNQNTQVASQKFTTTNADFIWFDLTDFDLSTDTENSWYLFYNQDDLGTAKAVNNFIRLAQNFSNFIKINPFKITNTSDFKDIDENNYFYNTSFIANIDYSILPNLTNWITTNKNIFAEAIKLQFCFDIYNLYMVNENGRSNRTERNINIETVKSNIYTTDAETVVKQLNTTIADLRTSIAKAHIDCINLPKKKASINFVVDL